MQLAIVFTLQAKSAILHRACFFYIWEAGYISLVLQSLVVEESSCSGNYVMAILALYNLETH